VENKEEKIVQPTPPSKSTSQKKQVWKVKVKSVSDSIQEEVHPVAPLDPSEMP
jgi:hypothetical protein